MAYPTHHIDAIVESARKRNLIIFCGAGVSMLSPSNSPSWWEIYRSASSALLNRFEEAFPEYLHKLQIDKLLAPFSTQQLANLIVTEFAGEHFVEILKVVDIADPNENHRHLVSLASNNNLSGIVTTNFDTLIERTAKVKNYSFNVITQEGEFNKRNFLLITPLIKIHGTAADETHLLETLDQKARKISPNLTDALNSVIQGKDLLVIGYSGADMSFGAVQTFFRAFIASGGHIWWLYRPNNKPDLVAPFRDKAIFIEGELPIFLRNLAVNLNLSDFEISLHGQDAQKALHTRMEKWSKEPHIGHWAASSFLLSLVDNFTKGLNNTDLYKFLMLLALREAEKVTPGSKLKIADFSLAGFLNLAGGKAMGANDFKHAETMFRAAVNIHVGINEALGNDVKKSILLERRMNLSTIWNNLGFSLLISGKESEAFKAFTHAMENAYLGGKVKGFLITLYNIVHFNLAKRPMRQLLIWTEAGIRLADKAGAVQPSIELRFLAVLFHIRRNEIWSASKILQEAIRRAKIAGDEGNLILGSIIQGGILLRRGLIDDGLTKIADTIVNLSNTAILSYHIEDITKYLELIGAPQTGSFHLSLKRSQIPDLVADIESKISASKANRKLPFNGGPFRVFPSGYVDENSARRLVEIGLHDFEKNPQGAIHVGLSYAADMLQSGYFHDVLWSTENLLANPDIGGSQLGFAYAYHANACVELALFESVDEDLFNAKHAFTQSSLEIPPYFAQLGLWNSIQSGNNDAAVTWINLLVKQLIKLNNPEKLITLIQNIDSWGPAMEPIGDVIRTLLVDAGITLPELPGQIAKAPFRFFTGTSTDFINSMQKEASQVIEQTQAALSVNDHHSALTLIESFLSDGNLNFPDWEVSTVIPLLVNCISNKMPPEKLDSFFDPLRNKFIAQFAFSSLIRLETSISAFFISIGHIKNAVDLLNDRDFIHEFTTDPLSKVSLFSFEFIIPTLLGCSIEKNKNQSFDKANFFGTAKWLWAQNYYKRIKSPNAQMAIDQIHLNFNKLIKETEDQKSAKHILTEALLSLGQSSLLSPFEVAFLHGEYANWALRMKLFNESRLYSQNAQRTFCLIGDIDNYLNAMACEARAWSREGHYKKSVEVYTKSLTEINGSNLKPYILRGLATAHLLESQRNLKASKILREASIKTYQDAIVATTSENIECPTARLGLARALGENGEQQAALREIDKAIEEFSRLGSPIGQTLKEIRSKLESGIWSVLGLS